MENLDQMKTELLIKKSKLESLDKKMNGGYTADMAKHFHLGMVGGSGNRKNLSKLNRRRESELSKTIELSKDYTKLCDEVRRLEKSIEFIESGKKERQDQAKLSRNEKLAEWFKQLKKGDTFQPGGNVLVIEKVNAKSIVTEGGCKWSALEVIGKAAAQLL